MGSEGSRIRSRVARWRPRDDEQKAGAGSGPLLTQHVSRAACVRVPIKCRLAGFPPVPFGFRIDLRSV